MNFNKENWRFCQILYPFMLGVTSTLTVRKQDLWTLCQIATWANSKINKPFVETEVELRLFRNELGHPTEWMSPSQDGLQAPMKTFYQRPSSQLPSALASSVSEHWTSPLSEVGGSHSVGSCSSVWLYFPAVVGVGGAGATRVYEPQDSSILQGSLTLTVSMPSSHS